MYIKHGSPVKMMEAYVTVLTKGMCQSDENGSFLIKDYDVRKAYLAGSVKGKKSKMMKQEFGDISGVDAEIQDSFVVSGDNESNRHISPTRVSLQKYIDV